MNRTEINKCIVNFYEKKFKKSFPENYDISNIYDVQQFIFDIAEPIEERCAEIHNWNESRFIYSEDNLSDIMKELGYSDIVFTNEKIERLDFDGDYDTMNYIFSYKEEKECSNTELSFVSYLGCHCDPIQIIQFIYFTILLYEDYINH